MAREPENLHAERTSLLGCEMGALGEPVAVKMEPLGRAHRMLGWDCAVLTVGDQQVVVQLDSLEYAINWVRAKAEMS